MGVMKAELAGRDEVRFPQFYSSAVSGAEIGADEDPQVARILALQRIQSFHATRQLDKLDMAAASGGGGGGGNSGDALARAASVAGPRLPQHAGAGAGAGAGEPVKLEFELVLKLLRESMQGGFQPLPRQKCASPVPYNSGAEGYQPMFYVSKEPKMSKTDDGVDGIPVRYQGFTKSTVWFSEKTPLWGLAARRMQHQSRQKQKQKGSGVDAGSMASKAALFFHVFEGFSYVLIRRSSPEEEVVKSNMAQYIVDKAAKFVQIWPVPRSDASTSPAAVFDAAAAAAHKTASDPSGSSLSTALNANLMRLKLQRGGATAGKGKRSIDTAFCDDDDVDAEQVASPKRQHSPRSESGRCEADSEAFFGLSDGRDGSEAAADFAVDDAAGLAIMDGFECDTLLEEALLSSDEDLLSGTSGESTLADFFLEESDDGFGNSLDPNGVVLCDIIFKTFCERMNQSQFSREYARVQGLLFNRRFGQSLRAAMDNKDPRVAVDFMFPGDQTSFCDSRPVGKLVETEKVPGGNEFVVQLCDEAARDALKTDPVGRTDVFDDLDNADMSFIMSKYYLLEHFGTPSQGLLEHSGTSSQGWWFQRLITRGDGSRAVLRGYATTQLSSTGAASRTIRLQDVTHLHQDMLDLPPPNIL